MKFGRRTRIAEILGELKVEEEYYKLSWNDKEFPERVITVEDRKYPLRNMSREGAQHS